MLWRAEQEVSKIHVNFYYFLIIWCFPSSPQSQEHGAPEEAQGTGDEHPHEIGTQKQQRNEEQRRQSQGEQGRQEETIKIIQ